MLDPPAEEGPAQVGPLPRAIAFAPPSQVSSPYRTLDRPQLRELLARELFDWGPGGSEGCELTLEALPCRPVPRAAARPRTWVRRSEPVPLVPRPDELIAALRRACAALEVPFDPAGRWRPWSPEQGARVDLGPGGQVRCHSGWGATPARAFVRAAGLQDLLRKTLGVLGLELLCVGFDPWHALEKRPSVESTPWGQCEERVFAVSGAEGGAALRLTAGTTVRLSFGGPVRGPRRWRAAWLLAPILRAAFAHASLTLGGSGRVKSLRGRAWRYAEPSRCGLPREGQGWPAAAYLDRYLDFALAARVLWVLRAGQAFPQTRSLSFEQWLAHGIQGEFPELDDWRAHLATLRPEVRPERALVLDGADAQGRAFAGVPLALAGALLCDDAALEFVLESLGGSPGDAESRLESAWREGLLDPQLAQQARDVFARAAEALRRAPPSWTGAELLAAFTTFERRFVRAGRTPADDLLDLFLERGGVDLTDLDRLELRWCDEAGASASWRGEARPA